MILEFGQQHQAEWVHTGKSFYKKFFDKELAPSKNQTSQSDILENQINVNAQPVFVTSAGSLGNGKVNNALEFIEINQNWT